LTSELREFLNKYDPSQNFCFNNLKYRPEAKIASGFGIDIDSYTNSFRVHLGVEHGYSRTSQYTIFSPFDVLSYEMEDQETMVLHSEKNIRIRISSINPIPVSKICAGTRIGTCSFLEEAFVGSSIEIMSEDEDKTILNELFYLKYGDRVNQPLSKEEKENIFAMSGFPIWEGEDLLEMFTKDMEIEFLNNFIIKKSGRFYYNPLAILRV